jgi:hypothetical protein
MQLYKNKETLYLSLEAEKIAKNEQHKHLSSRTNGNDRNYLESKLPDNGSRHFERRIVIDSEPKKTANKVCVCIEIW